ncbi:hypothetical protein [Polyangium sorediatum]|uniref:Uncharacterized protein n=1 Tax=Polyangium sorediatum TaxID=889274 RepID=A0ABT6P5D8_9BACT|nr:hypothetical protein [Polyangium sorediatum]MDI1435823.1 hypothetical protein [Polyangium sorediatum]
MDARLPPKLLDDLAQARETRSWTISGPNSRIRLADRMDDSDELPSLVPFGTDGGGGVWYCDVEDHLGGGAGSIVHLHMSGGYGDARRVAPSYVELLARLSLGFDPYDLPTLDEEASANPPRAVRVPGIEGLVDVRRMHARTRRPAEVVAAHDVLAAGFPARGGESIYLTDEGRIHFLTLAARAVVDEIVCAAGTLLSLHPVTGRPLRFTPAEPLVIDGLPLRAGHEVTVYDPVFSASVSGVLDRDHDVGGVPLAAETRVVLQGEARALSSGTLRRAARIGGASLAAGTWFELLGDMLYQTRPPAGG